MDIEIFVFLYLFIMIITVIISLYFYYKSVGFSESVKFVYALLIVFIVAYLCGLRDLDVGTDTLNYYGYFISNKEYVIFGLFDEPLIYFVKWFVKLFAGFHFFMFAISCIVGLSFLFFSKKIGESGWVLLFVLIFSFFLSFDLQVNVLKQGIATGFVLICLVQSKKRYIGVFGLLAILSHASAFIPISIYFLGRYIDKDVSLVVYFVSAIVSFFGFVTIELIEDFFSGIKIERLWQIVSTYKYYVGNYRVGFRWDFFLFNSIFVLLFYVKQKKAFQNKRYKDFFVLYVLTSSVFILMFNFPYSDRYGAYSWILIPILFYLSIMQYHRKYRDVWILVWMIINLFYLYYHIYGYVT